MAKELHKNICEESVFSGIYNKYSKDLYDFLYYKYGEKFNPEDKAQEAFVTLWNQCKQITLSKAKSYLFTVANNMMLNEIKHQKVVLKHAELKLRRQSVETPQFVLEEKEYLERYQKVLSKIPEDQRVAFMLSKVEGKKHAEIAEMLGVTKKVVEYRIYSAFDTLKKELEHFKIK